MIVELKRGYTIESNYDKFTDSYITRLLDDEGNQVRDALYSSDMIDRNYDVQEIKDFFNEYIDLKNKTGNIENEESTDIEVEEDSVEDNIEESLDSDIKKKARKIKIATKKAKLPALSTLSPIMPDGAAGIATFNSGVGLSEEWLPREELIDKIRNLGFRNYKFDKYTNEQLYRIYHERLNAVNKKRQERRDIEQAILDKANADYELAEREREVSKDQGSFFKDGIEFESEEAAKEYFGENMDKKIYLNDMHEAWDIKEDTQALNESLEETKKKTLVESLRDLDRKAFDIECRDTGLEMLYESMRDKLSSDDIKKLGSFLTRAETADEVATYMRGLLSEDLSEEDVNKYYKLAEDISNYANKEWNIWNNDIYDVDRLGNIVEIRFYVKGDWKHDHLKFDLAAREFLENTNITNFDIYEEELDDYDEYDSDYYPSVHVLKLEIDSMNESLNEARKPKFYDSMFAKKVIDAYKDGKLSSDKDIEAWEIEYNDDKKPNPPFNTKEIIRYYKSTNESLNEDYVEEWWGQTDEDPHDFANEYGLDIEKVDSKFDSTLYRFKGTRKAIRRAMADGYFYGVDTGDSKYVKEDESDRFYKLAGDLVHELQNVGFELDNEVEKPIKPNMLGGVHLQVKNKDMMFPIEEADSDDELAYKLMIDDLKEVRYVLDRFEDANDIDITFNFGPNKDNVITGGIDIRG